MVTTAIAHPIADALRVFRASLDRVFGERLREVTLFGSVARGEATEESDVDVLVVVDEVGDDERRVVFDLSYDAGARGDELIVISPLVWSTDQARDLRARERLITGEIARDGVQV